MQNWVAPASRVARAAQHLAEVEEGVDVDAGVEVGRLEQKAQSSGQAPDLALMRLSSSTSGPHQARRTWWARAISDGSSSRGRRATASASVAGQAAALVEQGAFGGGERHGDSLETGSPGWSDGARA